MGIDVADVNNDGHQEIGVVDMAIADHFRSKHLWQGMDTELFWYYINQIGLPLSIYVQYFSIEQWKWHLQQYCKFNRIGKNRLELGCTFNGRMDNDGL